MLLEQRVNRAIAARGTPTRVNSGDEVPAVWCRAQPGRVQMFLGETLEGVAAYEAALPAGVLGPPFALKIGDELTWLSTGWRGKVRALDAIDVRGRIVAVVAIVEMESE